MILAAHEAPYTLFVEDDNFPLNPRKDCDPFGKMFCWHNRYRLGDKHDYDDPEDFLRDLYRKSVDDNAKRLISFLKSGEARGARLEYNRHTHEWELYTYWCLRTIIGDSQPRWDLESSAPKSQLNDNGWFYDDMLNALTIDDLKELIGEREDLVILPLFLFDHSGITMSTRDFGDRWDSGQVGWIYADREMIEKNYGNINKETVKKAEEALEGEVESYDMYLRGECYGYRLYKDGEEEDSCWGFLGDVDDMLKELPSYLPDGCAGLVEKLEDCTESEKEYLFDHQSA